MKIWSPWKHKSRKMKDFSGAFTSHRMVKFPRLRRKSQRGVYHKTYCYLNCYSDLWGHWCEPVCEIILMPHECALGLLLVFEGEDIKLHLYADVVVLFLHMCHTIWQITDEWCIHWFKKSYNQTITFLYFMSEFLTSEFGESHVPTFLSNFLVVVPTRGESTWIQSVQKSIKSLLFISF